VARFIVGVMGAGENASPQAVIPTGGRLIAPASWALLTGGRNCGVMAAANRGAKEIAQSLTLGILPHPGAEPSPDVDLVKDYPPNLYFGGCYSEPVERLSIKTWKKKF
jgi:predicted Rossmann-fold nucleotide-binding protein